MVKLINLAPQIDSVKPVQALSHRLICIEDAHRIFSSNVILKSSPRSINFSKTIMCRRDTRRKSKSKVWSMSLRINQLCNLNWRGLSSLLRRLSSRCRIGIRLGLWGRHWSRGQWRRLGIKRINRKLLVMVQNIHCTRHSLLENSSGRTLPMRVSYISLNPTYTQRQWSRVCVVFIMRKQWRQWTWVRVIQGDRLQEIGKGVMIMGIRTHSAHQREWSCSNSRCSHRLGLQERRGMSHRPKWTVHPRSLGRQIHLILNQLSTVSEYDISILF